MFNNMESGSILFAFINGLCDRRPCDLRSMRIQRVKSLFYLCIGDDAVAQHGGHRDGGGRTPAHNVSHPPVTLSLSKRPYVEQESASDADGASERDYESYVDSSVLFPHTEMMAVVFSTFL